jgi:hypothetical protein
MKLSKLILTHGAVFAIGIGAAWFGKQSHAPANSSTDGPSSGTRSSTANARLDSSANPNSAPGSSAGKRPNPAKTTAQSAAEQLQAIGRIGDPFERQRALMDLIDTLNPGQFSALADQFRDMDHLGDSRGEYDLILGAWAKADPLTALEYVSQHGNSRASRATILATWAGRDAAAAERWALDNHSGDGPNPHLVAVIQGIASQDLANASRLAQSLPLSRERGEAIESITRALLAQGAEAAMNFPATIAEDMLRGGFVSSIANRLAIKNPQQAAAWVASLAQGDIQNRAARSVAGALARQDTKAATTWVNTLQPEARAEAARGIIPILSATDIPGTAQWVSSLAGTPDYDRVVEEFVWSCNTRAPEQSAAWIQGVSNPDQQRRLFHRMLGEWAQRDASAVKQWVSNNEVPADVLRRFSR